MNYQALFQGEYLKAAEFGTTEPTLTITDIKLEKLQSLKPEEEDKTKTKGVVYFREVDRGWVINRTNAECLRGMFGDETGDWIGKRVTLFATMVALGAKKELGIRVKGSPDIDAPVDVEIKLPRRRPVKMRLHPTDGGGSTRKRKPTQQPNTGPSAELRQQLSELSRHLQEAGIATPTDRANWLRDIVGREDAAPGNLTLDELATAQREAGLLAWDAGSDKEAESLRAREPGEDG